MCKLNGWKGCVCLLKELFLKIPEYFGTRPFSPLLELSIHRDGEIFILSCFYQHQRDNGVISPLSFGGYWGFHFAGWQATAADWMVAKMGRLVSQGEKKNKNKLSRRGLKLSERWSASSPSCRRKEGVGILFYTSITGCSAGIIVQAMVTVDVGSVGSGCSGFFGDAGDRVPVFSISIRTPMFGFPGPIHGNTESKHCVVGVEYIK